MKIRPTKLLIVGNPKVGTPVMLAAPSSAIDLPLKVLVWEDTEGKVWGYLQQPGLFAEAARPAKGVAAKHRGSRDISQEGRRIVNAI